MIRYADRPRRAYNHPLVMPASGPLYQDINDNHPGDDTGAVTLRIVRGQ